MADTKAKHLVRVMNTDLEGNKCLVVGMQKIRGVGHSLANMVCNFLNIDKNMKTGLLNEAQVKKIEEILKNPHSNNVPSWMLNRRRDYTTGENRHIFISDLDYIQGNDVRRLQRIKSNRGLRHSWNLPVRGQKTKSNFRKNKGKALGVKRRKGAKSGK